MTRDAHEIASRVVRAAYDGVTSRPSDVAKAMCMTHPQMAVALKDHGLPHSLRLISVGRMLAGMAEYLAGDRTLDASAKRGGWYDENTLSSTTRRLTGTPPHLWKEQGATLHDLLDAVMERHTGTLRLDWLEGVGEPAPKVELPFCREWFDKEREAHERRMRERDQGKRPPLDEQRRHPLVRKTDEDGCSVPKYGGGQA